MEILQSEDLATHGSMLAWGDNFLPQSSSAKQRLFLPFITVLNDNITAMHYASRMSKNAACAKQLQRFGVSMIAPLQEDTDFVA